MAKKRLLLLSIAAALVARLHGQATPEVHLRVLSHTTSQMVLQMELSAIRQMRVSTPRGEAVIPHFPGSTPLLRAGAPDVPKLATAVPLLSRGRWRLDVLGGDYEETPDVEVAPSKGNLFRNRRPSTVPFEYGEVYREDTFFPGALAELQRPFLFRQTRGQALWLYPVQYNPVRKVLRVYHTLLLRLVYEDTPAANEPDMLERHSAKSTVFSQLHRRLFVSTAPLPAEERSGPDEPERMLVIAPLAFQQEIEPLIRWKQQSGLEVDIVSVEEIGSNKADAIYSFVRQYYYRRGVTYLLLVGDDEAINPITLPVEGDDRRYACDNCFGYLSGDDHFPEVLVGRLHAATPQEARLMVKRILLYEKTPLLDLQADWFSTGMAAASDEGAGYGDDGQADWEHANEWKAKHLADGYTWYWEFYDGSKGPYSPTPNHPSADKDGDPLPYDLAEAIGQRGVSLFNYTGHGWEQGLSTGNFNNQVVRQLKNPGRYPILIAVGCSPGDFTGDVECLGEAWQRAGDYAAEEPWGGIAGLFSSVLQSWAPPMEAQDAMNQYLVDADGTTLFPTVGAMAAYGHASMIAAYGEDGEEMADFWNAFADPSTVPRTRFPQLIIAQHADTLDFGTTTLTLNCPVEGALVALYGQKRLLATRRVKGGTATLYFDPIATVEPLTLTLTQFNYLPYQKEVGVRPPMHPYVIARSLAVTDSIGGNGNGRLEYGEFGALRAVLQNIGLGTSDPLLVRVKAEEPLLYWVDTVSAVPALSAGDSVTLYFRFSVRSDVPHGARVNFILTLGDTLPNAPVYKTLAYLHAPKVEIIDWSLEGIAGPRTRRLEGGEVGRLHLYLRNNGGATSPPGTVDWVTSHSHVSISSPMAIGSLPAGGAVSATFDVAVSPQVPPSTWIFPEVELTTGTYTHRALIGPFVLRPILETFESGTLQQFPWQRSGHRLWQISPTSPYEGIYSLRAGGHAARQRSVLSLPLEISTPGWLGFAFRIATPNPDDSLLVFLNDTRIAAWWGPQHNTWKEVLLPIPVTGSHLLRWVFQKGDDPSTASAQAYLDEIILPAHSGAVTASEPESERLRPTLYLWPNPTGDELWIQTPATWVGETAHLQVRDALGRLVQTALVPAATERLSLRVGHLAAGIYEVRLHHSNREVVGRFVKN